MSIAHFLQIRDYRLGKPGIRIILSVSTGLPGIKMDLIYIHRRVINIFFLLLLHPLAVAPFVAVDLKNLRAGIGCDLHMCSIRVAFIMSLSVTAVNAILISIICFQSGNEAFPYLGIAEQFHSVRIFVPTVKISDQRNAFCFSSPDSEIVSVYSILGSLMTAKKSISLIIRAVMEKIQRQFIVLGNELYHMSASLICLFTGQNTLPHGYIVNFFR